MKKIIALLILFSIGFFAKAQLFKDIKRGVKKDIEWRIEKKAREKVSQGIDSLENKSKKKKKDKEEQKQTQQQKQEEEQGGTPEPGEGYITIQLSTPVTSKGLSVTISGESVKYEKWKTVKIEIKSPNNKEAINAALTDSGKYRIVWSKFEEDGIYTITATSSDGKATASEKLTVLDWSAPSDENDELMQATGTAFERLRNRASKLKGIISASQAAELDKKIAEVKEAVDDIREIAGLIKKGKQEIKEEIRAGNGLPHNISYHLTQMNLLIVSKSKEVQQLSDIAAHEPYENTVCEYITMLSEACSAFTTFTSGWIALLTSTAKNIAINAAMDKLDLHKPQEEPEGDYEIKPSSSNKTWAGKQGLKVFSVFGILSSKTGNLTNKWKQAQFVSNVINFSTGVLLRSYCGSFKGDVTHTYEIKYRNSDGDIWWSYAFRLEGAINLLYPKNGIKDGIIKMKGNIEGNATKFAFSANPANNPEFVADTKGKVEVMILKSMTPLAVPVSTSFATKDWGWIARATATPAYFNIPVDAEYNTETEKITLFIKPARLDFSEFVYNRQVFILWSAGLPLLRLMDYPISKTRLTLNATIKDQNQFPMKKNAKQELFFTCNASRHIGSKTDITEHILDLKISAKKE